MKVVCILQARMRSMRLPQKTLLPIHGRPMLMRVLDRLAFCKTLTSVVVATSNDPRNDCIRVICQREKIGCISAMPTDELVVGRLLEAAKMMLADAIVRISPDCPLIDAGIIDQIVETGIGGSYTLTPWPADYASNVYPHRLHPDGLDAEFITTETLSVLPEAENPTVYIWEHPERFRIASVTHSEDLSWMNWTVNYANDLEFVRWVYGRLPEGFSWRDVLALKDEGPYGERFWPALAEWAWHKGPTK